MYGASTAGQILDRIASLVAQTGSDIVPLRRGWSEKDAFLITYADSIQGAERPLRTLAHFLKNHVGSLISFVHLLPFYPYSSDDGFAVQDFRTVRNDLGTWSDVHDLANSYRLVFDGVINHVSASSVYMKGYCAGDPTFADFFTELHPDTDTSTVLRTRNLPLLHEFQTHAEAKWLWTTFSADQVDLNFTNPNVLLEILDVLLFYARNGASAIRLDAIPYLWKELGTSCAHLPRTHEIIKLIRHVYNLAAPHVLLLTETNVPHRENISYIGDRGDEAQMIYNFTLPPLIVWSLLKENANALTRWANTLEPIGPGATYLNITATHDGIGMRPTEGVLTEGEREELVQLAKNRGGDMTGKRNSDGSVSPYELNICYFDAINDPRRDETMDIRVRRFLLSQAIPLSLMGIPGIYIHSLLGSQGDHDGVRQTGRARSINRAQLTAAALSEELADSSSLRFQVFDRYSNLLGLRAMQSAFHPDASQEIIDFGARLFAVKRVNEETGQTIMALHNVTGGEFTLKLPGFSQDILSDAEPSSGTVTLLPYQVRWLT